MFNYLAKCGWLFDGFFSHGQLAVESIFQLANSTIRRRTLGSGHGSPAPGVGRRAASENLFDLIRLNSPIEGWIRRPTAHGRRIHRITDHI